MDTFHAVFSPDLHKWTGDFVSSVTIDRFVKNYNEINLSDRRFSNMSKNKEPSLKGTFASVLILGAFILVSWLGVFLLYLARN